MLNPTPSNKPLLVKVLQRQGLVRPPVWLMRQAGRYLPEYRAMRAKFPNFLEFCLTPDAATEVTLQPLRRFELDAAIIFADILTIPHALGHTVTFTEGYGPQVVPVRQAQDVTTMRAKLPDMLAKLAPINQTVRQVRAALPKDQAVIGFSGGPWTLMAYLFDTKPSQGVSNLLRFMTEEPQAAAELRTLLTEAIVAYLSAQIRAGADAVQVFESWAGLCPPEAWQDFVHQPLVAIAQRLQADAPETPAVLFPRLANPAQLLALATDPALPPHVGLGLSTEVDMAWAVQTLQPHRAIQGNIDPLLMTGPAAPLAAATAKLLNTAAPQPGFVVNLGHGLTPQTDPARVAELVAQVRAWHYPQT